MDAIAAARTVQSGEATGTPKAANAMWRRYGYCGWRTARRSRPARKAANQLHALVVTAPLELREQLRDLPMRELVERCARLRPGEVPDSPIAITTYTLRRLARRFQQLDAEAGELKAQMRRLIKRLAPPLLAEQGISTITASALLVAAGDNPERLRSEGSFAHLCGVAPLDASSGKQQRRRLTGQAGGACG